MTSLLRSESGCIVDSQHLDTFGTCQGKVGGDTKPASTGDNKVQRLVKDDIFYHFRSVKLMKSNECILKEEENC